MRHVTALAFALLALAGCGREPAGREPRTAITLEEFAVTVRGRARGFMLSDRRGGFLTGWLDPGALPEHIGWSAGGRTLLHGWTTSCGGEGELPLDSARVEADRVTLFLRGGIAEIAEPVEGCTAGRHILAIRIRGREGAIVSLRTRGNGGGVFLYPGRRCDADSVAIVLEPHSESTVLVLDHPASPGDASLFRCIDSLADVRRLRMESLLNRTYLRTDNSLLNNALYWMKMALDALVVESGDTLAVAGLPWDGSRAYRENVQSVTGLALAAGGETRAAALLRSIARRQNRNPADPSFGRLARIATGRTALYDGADVSPLFVRALYEEVVVSGDTELLRSFYPVVLRSIIGTLKYHTDANNLLVHGARETWMSEVPRGNRAAEIQMFWYYQQLIGSFMAVQVGDSVHAREWSASAGRTADSFQSLFVDTARLLVYDHLREDGSGSGEMRPNALLCLDLLKAEALQQNVISSSVRSLVSPSGVSTLAAEHRPSAGAGEPEKGGTGAWKYNGPAWTWLAGQVSYALTRYDCQDLAFTLTRAMAERSLEEGVVGTLPEMIAPACAAGERAPRDEGQSCSLSGMAEFVRSWYQDYIGIHVDAPAHRLSLAPRLPRDVHAVEFTAWMGRCGITGTIEREETFSRITLHAPALDTAIVCSIFWVQENGDAWRASARLPANRVLRIVIGPDDLAASLDQERIDLVGARKLRNYSLRKTFDSLSIARQRE